MHRRFSLVRYGRRIRPFIVIGALGAAACQNDLSTAPAASDGGSAGGGASGGTGVSTGTPSAASSANPLASFTFYIDQASSARKTADAWRTSRPEDAAQMEKLASQPVARWFGNWNADIRGDVASAVDASAARGAVPVFVAYNIPQRDCGGLSGGNNT